MIAVSALGRGIFLAGLTSQGHCALGQRRKGGSRVGGQCLGANDDQGLFRPRDREPKCQGQYIRMGRVGFDYFLHHHDSKFCIFTQLILHNT